MRPLFLFASLAAAIACSSSSSTDDGGTDASPDDVAANDVVTSDAGPTTVSFSYKPSWTGVTAVSVLGGFGLSGDWTSPFLALADDGTGTYRGSATLAPGQYLYVFKVVGDDAASAKYSRYAIDPNVSTFAACPQASPTFDANAPNPCSQLAVPQGAPASLVHVQGVVVSDGAPIAGYLVQLDRDETGSHHFFVNRDTTASDGAFDLVAAPGTYRVQVLHPTFLSETDVQRDPVALAALRRDISSSFALASSAVVIPSAEVAFHGYGSFAPIDSGTLPTTFSFTKNAPTRLDVYGTGMDGGAPTIGDPWFSSSPTQSGSATFDGGFNTAQANEKSVVLGERYFWGVEENIATDAGVNWTAQSMVFDITWH